MDKHTAIIVPNQDAIRRTRNFPLISETTRHTAHFITVGQSVGGRQFTGVVYFKTACQDHVADLGLDLEMLDQWFAQHILPRMAVGCHNCIIEL